MGKVLIAYWWKLNQIGDNRYRVFGDPPSQRAAEDLAFSVARFFSKNGTLANYYMVLVNLCLIFR